MMEEKFFERRLHRYKMGGIKWSSFSVEYNQYWYHLNVNTHAVLSRSDLDNKNELKSKICWYYKDYLTSKKKTIVKN